MTYIQPIYRHPDGGVAFGMTYLYPRDAQAEVYFREACWGWRLIGQRWVRR